MKKKISLVLITLVATLSLTACGKFTCDLCGEEKSGKSYSYELLGSKLTICNDCYKEIKDLYSDLEGLF